jgi:antitoxin MazE
MLTTIRAIGNSKGILIPAAFLASCHIEDKVDMQLQDGQIVIRPVKSAVREGWFANAANENLDKAADKTWADAHLADDSEWVW